MHISIIAVERSCGLKVFHLWLLSYLVQFFFMIPDIFFIFWYWSLHMQIVSWSTQDFTPRNHFATATWSTTERVKQNKNWIFVGFVNKTMHFPSSYWTPFSHLFREKIWNFCLNFPALLLTSISWVSTHCQVFSLNPIWQYSVQLLNCNFGIFVGKILWRSGNFKNVVEIFSEMMKRLFTFLLCNNNKSA